VVPVLHCAKILSSRPLECYFWAELTGILQYLQISQFVKACNKQISLLTCNKQTSNRTVRLFANPACGRPDHNKPDHILVGLTFIRRKFHNWGGKS
jgi:hypothetical protein